MIQAIAVSSVSGIIGKQAIVVDEIDNLQGLGKVTVGGQEWTARSTVEDQIIPVGTVVVVEEVKGVKLMVRSTPKVVEIAEES